MTIIDSHLHFWDQSVLNPYVWLHEVPTIAHRHAPATLRIEAPQALPDKIIFVECGAPWLEEVRWVEQLAQENPFIAGIVARISIDAGLQTTEAIAELRRHPLVRGVRHQFEHESLDYCSRPEFITGVRELASAGLSFDLCCKHPQLPAVVTLVQRCPGVSFVLDHGGKPGIRDGLLDPWREHIRQLAALPNVVCKLSGLVTEADHEHWTPAQLKPYVTHLLDTFGPSRLLFGGDWPVSKLACGYPRWLELAREFTAHLPLGAQMAIFQDNARQTYRI